MYVCSVGISTAKNAREAMSLTVESARRKAMRLLIS